MTNRRDLPDPMHIPDADHSTGYARAPLRILTCGSVDAGKSTLIGRLLRDGRTDAPRDGGAGLAVPVETLDDERPHASGCESAHHAFASPNRCFTIAEAPGHENDIHDFAAAAATSDLAILLIDARWGPCVQTRRLAHIAALLGIREVILAVNKIDLVDHSQAMFDRIVGEFVDIAARLGFRHIQPIPISARDGDTVRRHSGKTPWYDGPTLLGHLERVEAGNESAPHFRFAVQGVDRPGSDRPGLSGKVVSGAVRAGDEVVAAASGKSALIARIVGAVGDQPEARAGEAVALVLDRETEIASGDILAPPRDRPSLTDQFAAHILWLDRDPLLPSRQYTLRIGDISTPASVTTIKHRVDLDSLDHAAARTLERNEIGFCNFSTARRVALDPFARNRATGRFLLIDRFTDRIAGFGLVSFSLFRADNIHPESFLVDKAARSALNRQVPIVLWFTGLSGSGKSTIAKLVEQRLHLQGKRTFSLDGDNVRHGLNRDLGFSDADRVENIRRIGEVAKLFTEAGLIVICSFISPFRAERRMARGLLAAGEFVEIFVDTPIEECIRRDPKGLYAKAKRGEIRNFTGVDSPYETPEEPELRIETVGRSAEESVDQVLAWLARREA